MAANTTPIFPLKPFVATAELANATGTAITSGAPITGTTGLVVLVPVGASQTPTSADGTRIDRVTVRVAGTAVGLNAACQVWLWLYNGTTSWLIDELLVPAVTSTASTVAGATVSVGYPNLVLPTTWGLYVSTTVTPTDASGILHISAYGGTY